MSEKKKSFKPLIHTVVPPKKKETTLREKNVEILGTMNFARHSGAAAPPPIEPLPIPVPEEMPTPQFQEPTPAPADSQLTHATPISPLPSTREPKIEPLPLITKKQAAPTAEEKAERAKIAAYRKATMKTQKMSLDVMQKLEILDPFLRSAENITADRKISINEKIDLLIDAFLTAKLTTRQMEGFKAIYENYLSE